MNDKVAIVAWICCTIMFVAFVAGIVVDSAI